MKTTEVISVDGRQAVRLPDEFSFAEETVSVREEGDAVILEPVKSNTWPAGFFEAIRIDDPAPRRLYMPQSTYIRDDEHGVKRVGQTRVMLDSVIAAFHQGHSAETIAQQYPALTLEEIYGTITYYLANKAEVDEYLRRQDEVWKQACETANKAASPVVARLRSQAARAGTDAP